MFKRLKIKARPTEIWVTGCLHAFHKQPFIWQKRGYNSPEEHAAAVIETINEYVKPEHKLIVLGDGFLNATDELVIDFWKKINCKFVKYIFGNHESIMGRLYKNSLIEKFGEGIEVYPYQLLPNVEILGNYVESYINGRDITFSHFPLAIWNNSHHGAIHLHSHCHSSFKESLPDYPVGKRLDCGWDVLGRPYNMEEIAEIMERKGVQVLDHHTSATT
jgi:calcineurin-like phosphoesterase family protein